MTDSTAAPRQPISWMPLVALGCVTGFFSGFLGLGGGVILVPGLVFFCRFAQRAAVGTSLAAIIPISIVGSTSYFLHHSVALAAAACLALGMILGAQLGSRLLQRLRTATLQWLFMLFLVAVIVELLLEQPVREAAFSVSPFGLALLGLIGICVGVLSGVLGVGGGIIIVPVLMLGFGASDLVAKGTSLAAILPGSLSGTIANVRNANVNIRAALILGVSASALTWLGALSATLVAPIVSNVALSALLGFILVRMLIERLRGRRSAD